MNAGAAKFRKALGYSILGILAMYLILALWLTVIPGTILFNRKLTNYYRWVALPGPFFNEERIRTPVHFWISYKRKQDNWTSSRNPQAEQLQRYRESFFDYNSLQQARATNFMAQTLYDAWRKDSASIVTTSALRQIHAHLKRGYIPADADSVRMLYLRGLPQGDMGSREVLFHFTYRSF